MGITDIFNASKIKEENEQLKRMLTPEMQNAINLQNHIRDMQQQAASIEQSISSKNNELFRINQQIESRKSQLIVMDEEVLFQDFALYTPKYDFCNSAEYKDRLTSIRNQQKQLIKSGSAVTGDMNWNVNGSASQGKKMVKDMQKLLLRAFNSECDEVIGKVKYNNIESSEKRIRTSCDAISKLGQIMHVAITGAYYNLKIQELYLSFEYQQKKQEEKEALKEARAEMREAAKLQKELDEQRKKVEKEQNHYQNALLQILRQIKASGSPSSELLEKKSELEAQLGEIELTIKDLDYREANQRAGYVYVISNIGAFGENIYKIGMTRRLDPQDRIDELGSASVPFNFDVHAMIFSDDAPALEAALHRAFENRKLNMINQRREFFYVTLDEIKEVIRNNYDRTVEFIDIPDAQQYRESLKLKGLSAAPYVRTVPTPTPMPAPASRHAPAHSSAPVPAPASTHPMPASRPTPTPPPVTRTAPLPASGPVPAHSSAPVPAPASTHPQFEPRITPPIRTPESRTIISTNQYNREKLYTKWGVYEMPNPYRPKLTYGPRNDAVYLSH